MYKTIIWSLWLSLLSSVLLGQKSTLSGVVTDEASGEALIGATVTIGKTGTVTDFDGKYSLDLENGGYVVQFSYVGYATQERSVSLQGDETLNVAMGNNSILDEVVVTADIAIERETPVAFSNIPSVKIREELGAQDIPMILNSTPGVYATEAGGGDGDARISIRGFDQKYVAVMLNGIPVNDMENGEVYWSNWFGLDLVTQTMQVQRGLGASKISIPSVGGTINILTKGIDAEKSLKIRQEVGNNGFLRTTMGLTSGRLKNGWGISLAGSYKEGDGWVDGNFTQAYFYYARIDKQLGDHLLSLTGFGAPQKHGQRPFSAEIGQVDSDYALSLGVPSSVIEELEQKDRGRRYNDTWGYRDGEVLNTRQNYYHKPQISLRHSWQANERLFWSNVAYLSIGDGGGVAPDGASITFTEDGQRDIDQTILNNQPTVFNPDGISNTILRSNRNNHFWYGLLSTLRYNINKNMTLSGGFDGRSYDGDHFREVFDLLGGTGWQGGQVSPNSPVLQVGDKYEYDYTGKVRSLGAFGLFEYKENRWASFLNLSVANAEYGFVDNLSQFELPFVDVQTLTAKLGATYKFNRQHSVFFNTGVLNKAQPYQNVIITNFWAPATDAQVANNYENEDIRAVELGYSYKSRRFSANFNAYYTIWGNKPLDRLPTIAEDESDPESDRIPVNIPGIDALHKGIEIDFVFKPRSNLSIEGLVSIGDWTWQSGETVEGVLPNGVPYSYEFDATGVHVGDAAQLQIGGQVRYEPVRDFYVTFKSTFFDNNYADFQPENLQGDNGGRESWQMPSYALSSFHSGYYFKWNKVDLNARFNMLNVFDAVYLTDARDNDDFNSPSFTDFDAKSASVFYGQGRRWSFSLQASF
jgi:hypothetical protein